MADYPKAGPPPPHEARITRTATEARQGEIVLGRFGRWLWLGVFALIVVIGLYAWS
jgi:hypothetical protein